MVTKSRIIRQAPLTPGVVMAPAVALPGKIDPLGMAEFVAHEGHITASAQAEGKKPNQLMQGHPPVRQGTGGENPHLVVHGGIHEPEDDGFISHQGLIMALGVGDGAFMGPAVGQGFPYPLHMPFFIPLFLDGFYPEIRNSHGQTVVEPCTALAVGHGDTGQAAHVFGDGDGFGMNSMNQIVGQNQVVQGIFFDVRPEVFFIVIEGSPQAVVLVEHGGDSVEPEAVNIVFGKPVGAGREEKMDHLILAVVETAGIPRRVVPPVSGVKVEIFAAVLTA